MKSSHEMVNSLLERRDRYIAGRRRRRRAVIRAAAPAGCLCLVALMGLGVWRGEMPPALPDPPDNGSPVSDDHTVGDEGNTAAAELNIIYETISQDWPFYGTADELIDASDKVILGTVTGVSFQMLDIRTGKAQEGEADEAYCCLHTIYDIDTLKTYKGEPNQKEQVRVIGGIEGAYEAEQAAALGEQERPTVFVLGDRAKLKEGETYLLMLAQYEDAIPTIVNVEQGIYDIADVQSGGPDEGGEITVRDIISSFGQTEWDKFESLFLRAGN